MQSEGNIVFVLFFSFPPPSSGDFIDLNESSAENEFEKPYRSRASRLQMCNQKLILFLFCFFFPSPSSGDFIDLNESSAENEFEKPYR